MRLACWLLHAVAVAASALCGRASTSEPRSPSQWIVLGTDGLVVDVDPTPFLPENRERRKLLVQALEASATAAAAAARDARLTRPHVVAETQSQRKDELAEAVELAFFDDDEDEDEDAAMLVFVKGGSQREVDAIAKEEHAWQTPERTLDSAIESIAEEEDEWEESGNAQATNPDRTVPVTAAVHASFVLDLLAVLEDAGDVPGMQGSIAFAELSCVFVAFIGYLVHSIPLWPSFSRGQKGCLVVAFSAAGGYQFVVLGWYLDLLSPDVMLGISSLITRMISLGMVPITTTSFMGRARIASAAAAAAECDDGLPLPPSSSRPAASSHSGHGRHRHHPRARSS